MQEVSCCNTWTLVINTENPSQQMFFGNSETYTELTVNNSGVLSMTVRKVYYFFHNYYDTQATCSSYCVSPNQQFWLCVCFCSDNSPPFNFLQKSNWQLPSHRSIFTARYIFQLSWFKCIINLNYLFNVKFYTFEHLKYFSAFKVCR